MMVIPNPFRHARMAVIPALALGLGLWSMTGTALAQPSETELHALRQASRLSESIQGAFQHDDVRLGYAQAIRLLMGFAQEHEESEAWDILKQMVASEAANIGMHETALEAMGDAGQLTPPPAGLEVVDAIEAVVDASGGHRVLMLNEAHHVGLHREFARRLLKPLREAGFTHLACEAFANAPQAGFEIDAASLGYATRKTGYYIADPFFAELVREAVELGFELVAYETLDLSPPGQESHAASVNRRDSNQAKQLAAVLQADPEARLFVYCGYAHLTESQVQIGGEPVRWLAARLHDQPGIDPLTVSQTTYYSKHAQGHGHAGIAGYEADDAFVLRSGEGYWSADPERYDIELLHPSMERVGDRPGWMFRAPERARVRVGLGDLKLSENATLIVTRENEQMDAIPSDVVVIRPDQAEAWLTLRAGAYRVWLVGGNEEPRLIDSPVVE